MKPTVKKIGAALLDGAKNTLSGVKRRWMYLLIILACILLDQVTKYLATAYLRPVGDFPIWDGVLHLTYTVNPGAAFGMLADNRAVFMVISGIAIPAMLVYLLIRREATPLLDWGLALVVGGGIGNMFDRIGLGYVVDFIYFKIINFAKFNIADSCVCIGAGLIILALLRDIIREAKALRAERDTQ